MTSILFAVPGGERERWMLRHVPVIGLSCFAVDVELAGIVAVELHERLEFL
jgi:hypothetical protein